MHKTDYEAITATLDGLLDQTERAIALTLDVVIKTAHAHDCDRVCIAAQEAKMLSEFRDQMRGLKREWESQIRGR